MLSRVPEKNTDASVAMFDQFIEWNFFFSSYLSLPIYLSISKKDIEYFLVSESIDGHLCSSIYMHARAHVFAM